ncbi:sensor domain-containing diguanylate cyclase [Halalkalibacter nanhaiisediminis]|uniref:PAS domain S-box-containing protein/diguanylate cyclase (GGDEF)-like protein n=1 Tax=Halalkalibacter nanhaiisediminis TaxID=688079 RepID=A0A562QCI2_9BACI|nr:sensor domain-containing diguanylate cyclase [Halalkalibacter nanhaiisediminis]TWI54462.1 PAS domain S-box-containing protein/diguanylate cyclase (GGDEF)-like protein [Halalkalibacter nanhaiisediminis]
MKWQGRFIALLIIIIMALFIIYDYTAFDHENILHLLIIILILPLMWWSGKQYDELFYKHLQLKKEKEQIEEKSMTISQKNEDYELLLDSLDGGIFSYDVLNHRMYSSKGMAQLYGQSDATFFNNPYLLKKVIHPDDYEKVNKDDLQLLSGQSSKVEYRIIDSVYDEKWVMRMAVPIQNQDGTVVKINGQMFDITERKQLEHELKQMAFFDDLTDLPNRKSLDRHIEKALARSKRHNHNFILLFIDLDDFKIVNDTIGHDAGDELLKEVVKRLNQSIREEDLVARIGGDEFIVVFEETSTDEIENIAQRIIEGVSLPYSIDEKEAKISLSIGVSVYPDDGEDKETLIEHADKAMYFAKNHGKNGYKLYSPELSEMEFKKVGLLEKWKSTIQKSTSKIFN